MEFEIFSILKGFGPLGMMIAYMVWEKRYLAKERLEADKALTATLAALKTVIERLDR